MDVGKDGGLDFDAFQKLVKSIRKRTELEGLFNSLAKSQEGVLIQKEFKDFLINTQNVGKDFLRIFFFI